MTQKNDWPIALVKEACPLCGAVEDGPLLISKRKYNPVVKKMHGQVVGYMDKPCKECQKLMEQGFLLIGVVESKTDDKKNPYRSGNQWVIRKEAAEKIFTGIDLSKGSAFIPLEVAEMAGLPGINWGA